MRHWTPRCLCMVQVPILGKTYGNLMAIMNIEKAAIVSFNRLEDYLQPLDILETLPYYKTIVMQKDSEFTELFNRQILKMQVRTRLNLLRIWSTTRHYLMSGSFWGLVQWHIFQCQLSSNSTAQIYQIWDEVRGQVWTQVTTCALI